MNRATAFGNKPSTKPHDEELRKRCERRCRQATTLFLRNLGRVWDPQPFGKYDIDLRVVDREGKTLYLVDWEWRSNWAPPEIVFPYPTIHVPARKLEMCRRFSEKGRYFAFRNDYKMVAIAHFSVIAKCPIIKSDTKHTSGESFIDVPTSYWVSWSTDGVCQNGSLWEQDASRL